MTLSHVWRQVVRALCCALMIALAGPALAQTDMPDPTATEEAAPADSAPSEAPAEGATTTDPAAFPQNRWLANAHAIDYAAWEDFAVNTEELLLRDQARPFALERLRVELTDWRDRFTAQISQNDARLTTVNAQIAALGPPPADGESEATAIANRRAELIALRDLLAQPGLLAAEAHARAIGLFDEVEIQLRERQADDLLQRNPSPLSPGEWAEAIPAVGRALSAIGVEMADGVARLSQTAEAGRRLFLGLGAVALALALFLRGRSIADALFSRRTEGLTHLAIDFLRTIAEAVIPLSGILALTYGLSLLDVFGPRGEAVLATVPLTGSIIILTGWLARQFFPLSGSLGPLCLADDVRLPARRTGLALAWVAALWIPLDAFLRGGTEEARHVAVLAFPLIIVVAILLFRFATLLRHPPSEEAGPNASQGRTRKIIGRLAQAVALATPVLAAAGYGAAAEAVLFPTILTLGIIGVVVYLQSTAYRAHELLTGTREDQPYALLPVVVGLVLLLVSVPVLALVWGADRSDLAAWWARFTDGFTFGATQISPSDVIWFLVIFTLGYLLTQFIKTTLRTSVLPRTKLDIGAQNALVAGFGYVGIFLAAVVAITSAGIDLSNLAIVAGALSVGIGFGLQTIVSNFVSGIILLIERPISEGDWIEVDGRMGIVRDISVRSTRIETFDQTDVIVPNADLVSNQVINWTRGNLVGRLILPVGVAYGSDIDKVMGILREVAEGHPLVIVNPPPGILFMNFGADALEFEIRAILRDVNFIMAARSEMNTEIAKRFAEAGIEIPFAQRDIWLRNPEVLGNSDRTGTTTPPPRPRYRDHEAQEVDGDGDSDGGSPDR